MSTPPDLSCPSNPAESCDVYDPEFFTFDAPRNTLGTDLTVPGSSHDCDGHLEIFNEANNCFSMDQASSGWNPKGVGSYGFGTDQWLSNSTQNCLNPRTQIYSASHASWAANASLSPDMLLDSGQDDTYGTALGKLISSPMCSGYSSKPNEDSFDGEFERLPPGSSSQQAYPSLQGYVSPSITPTAMPWSSPLLDDIGQLTQACWLDVWPGNTPIIVSSKFTATDPTCNWQVRRNSLHSVVPSLGVITDAHSSSPDSVLTPSQNPASKWPLGLHGCNMATTDNMVKTSLEKPSKGKVRRCFPPEKRRKVASVRDSRACILCRVNKSEVGKIILLGAY
jgi:hypothetical protein